LCTDSSISIVNGMGQWAHLEVVVVVVVVDDDDNDNDVLNLSGSG